MPERLELAGTRFTKLVAISPVKVPSKQKYRKKGMAGWLCKCDCGNKVSVITASLVNGSTLSCGCINRAITIQRNKDRKKPYETDTPTYKSWRSMKMRCLVPKATSYQYYGAKGVTICKEWLVYQNFLNDMGERPKGKTLDRINTFGNYEPSNCKWSTVEEQNRNKRCHYE